MATARRTIAYARVSSHDQKADLERQKQVLELYCARQGWTFEVLADLGSGMNYHKKGLKRLSQRLSKKQKGSQNRKKMKMKLASLHARIANIRCSGNPLGIVCREI